MDYIDNYRSYTFLSANNNRVDEQEESEESEVGENTEQLTEESADELQRLIQIDSQILDYTEKTYQATMCIIYFLVFAFVFKLLFKNIFSWLNGG